MKIVIQCGEDFATILCDGEEIARIDRIDDPAIAVHRTLTGLSRMLDRSVNCFKIESVELV